LIGPFQENKSPKNNYFSEEKASGLGGFHFWNYLGGEKMNRKVTILITVLALATALISGCTDRQSSAADATHLAVSPIETSTETTTESAASTPEPTPTLTPKPKPTATEKPVTYNYDGWQPFESIRFGYAFLAPPDVEVLENGMDGTVNLAGPLVDNERWPRITISSADSDVFRPPAGADVVEWVANSGLTSREVESGIDIGGLPSAHVVTPASSRAYAADDYYVIHDGRLIRIAITHSGHKDWELYNAFLASFTFDDATTRYGPG
jgi:hypothetical protein